jgi:acyl transferase domain-containing protein
VTNNQDAVAIVGLGAVFPGAGDVAAFWRNITAGTDSITEVTPDRWDPAVYCDQEQAGAAAFYCRRGGFLGELATFDPHSFGIMPASVDGTEPDQLLMLRAAAAAIADGGALADRERTGVIIGRGGYLTPGLTRLDQRVTAAHQLTAVLTDLLPCLGAGQLAAVRAAFAERLGRDDPQDSVGLVPNFAASRLANRFDLRGPAYTVDAACASSLIAVDHAVRELTSGRCDAVLAGGVHTCHHPTLWSVFTRLRVLSPGGVIRPFDAAADGTLLSEGAGAVLLKRLADARAAGDRVYAVIRGVGTSSDGRASGMLNPLVEGQELAIRRAWAAAGLDPAAPGSLGLLEAHGTATPTGDRAELTALGRVFGPAGHGPAIGIGTVKSMIGHAMPAAGIAGLIKAALAVHEGVLPPTLHVDEPNPALAGTRFTPVTTARPWDDGPVRRAAVSAFGFGGINAHVVIESEPAASAARGGRTDRQPAGGGVPVRPGPGSGGSSAGVSGRSGSGGSVSGSAETVLRLAADSVGDLAAALRAPDAALLTRASGDPGRVLGTGSCRLAIVAPDTRRLALARKVVERGVPWRGRSDIWFTPRPLLTGPEQVAFLYPGFEPGFAPRTEGVAAAFGLPEPRLHRPADPGGAAGADGVADDSGDGAGPAVWHAVDLVAVGRLFTAALREMGITPGLLAGHSLGEWTAMVAAGVYPDIDAFIDSVKPGIVELPDLVYLALGAGAARAAGLIGGLAGMWVTHDNCPRQSVVCGPAAQVATVARRAREAGVLAQAMPFRTGFHSPAFAPHVPVIRRTLGGLAVRAAQVPVWSATTLEPFPADPDQIRALVLRHLVEPVRFRELTGRLHDAGIRAFVQVGPGSLTGFTEDTLNGRDYLTVATATVKRDGLAQLRRTAAALWAEGLSPRFDRLAAGTPATGPARHSAGVAGAALGGAGAGALGGDDATGAGPGGADPAGAGREMRLRLGVPLVRLAGLMEPLTRDGDGPGGGIATGGGVAAGGGVATGARGGDGGAVLAPGSGNGGPPALAELTALLAETTATAESVVAAALGGPTPAAPAPAAPAPAATSAGPGDPEGRRSGTPDSAGAADNPGAADSEFLAEREFSLRTMPEIADHCLIPAPGGWPDDSDRFPIVPLTTLLEIMGDAALQLAPGQVVTGFQQVRATRWLTVAPPTRTTVRASRAGPGPGPAAGRVRVSIDGYASGYVLLGERYPAPPPADGSPLRGREEPPVSARELYADRWMFHGPRFAGVASVGAVADDGIEGTVLSLPARGALLDSVGQLIGHWMQVVPPDAQTVLPTGIEAVQLFGPPPAAGQRLGAVARIRELTDTEMRANAEVREASGRVWAQVTGWTTRRFATDDAIVSTRREPGAHGLSVLAPGGYAVAFERWQDTASRELIMRLYLNAAERADYERLPPFRQRRWLLGRIAVKDAVRAALWERGAGLVFPAELTVTGSGDGVAVSGAFSATPVSLALSQEAPGRPCAVAAAGHHPGLSVEAGPDGTVLVRQPGRPPVAVTTGPDAGPAAAMTTSGSRQPGGTQACESAAGETQPRETQPRETPGGH